MDSRTPTLIAASLLLACCSPRQAENAPAATNAAVNAVTIAPAPETPAATNTAPAPTPDTPTAQDEVSPEVATEMVREYFALLGAKQYDMARALWEPGAAPTEDALAAQMAKYTSYDATIGKAGDQEGAAGSSYLEVPVTVAATAKGGGAEKLSGTVTLRRVNDVPGSTAAQRHWHIYRIELK
jgi:hypothetical protein